MASHEDLLASALNLDRGRISRYCRTVDPRFLERLNSRKPTTMAALADIWYGSQNADYGRSQHYNDSRYHKSHNFTKGLSREALSLVYPETAAGLYFLCLGGENYEKTEEIQTDKVHGENLPL